RDSSLEGSDMTRVHSTTPSGNGEPDATPRLNGWFVAFGGAAREALGAVLRSNAAPTFRSVLRSMLPFMSVWFYSCTCPGLANAYRSHNSEDGLRRGENFLGRP